MFRKGNRIGESKGGRWSFGQGGQGRSLRDRDVSAETHKAAAWRDEEVGGVASSPEWRWEKAKYYSWRYDKWFLLGVQHRSLTFHIGEEGVVNILLGPYTAVVLEVGAGKSLTEVQECILNKWTLSWARCDKDV